MKRPANDPVHAPLDEAFDREALCKPLLIVAAIELIAVAGTVACLLLR